MGLTCLATSHAAAQKTGQSESPQQFSVSTAADHKLVGVGSCTSVGCHGGGRPESIIGSEYNIWIAEDPHSRAYSTLFDERSQRMVQLLNGLQPDSRVAAHEDKRCLACHSMTHAPRRDERHDVVSDGVGCESCHGPAGDWLSDHFRRTLTLPDRERLGLWNTERLLVRTQICVGCHVGGPGREVNHDLMAAGHPRLQFEMGAYFEALPKHWLDKEDREGRSADFDARLWAIGQACTSQAALEQLARRASHGTTWPEFAEWECSACHHDLRDNAAQQDRLAEEGGLSGQLIDWDTWNHFMTRGRTGELRQAFEVNQSPATSIDTKIESLAELMRQLSPDRQHVSELAQDTAKELERFALDLETSSIHRENLNRLMRLILSSKTAAADWSTAAQTYNALATLQETRLGPAPNSDDAVSSAIQRLYDDLAAKQRAPKTYVFHPEQVTGHLKKVGERLPASEAER